MLKCLIIVPLTVLGTLFFGVKFFREKKIGCKVCIHGQKDAEHTGLCTLFIEKKDKMKK